MRLIIGNGSKIHTYNPLAMNILFTSCSN